MSDDNYTKLLAEELKTQRTQILEALGGLKDVPKKLDQMDERLKNVELIVQATKAAVTDQSKQLNNHEQRLTVLEAV